MTCKSSGETEPGDSKSPLYRFSNCLNSFLSVPADLPVCKKRGGQCTHIHKLFVSLQEYASTRPVSIQSDDSHRNAVFITSSESTSRNFICIFFSKIRGGDNGIFCFCVFNSD